MSQSTVVHLRWKFKITAHFTHLSIKSHIPNFTPFQNLSSQFAWGFIPPEHLSQFQRATGREWTGQGKSRMRLRSKGRRRTQYISRWGKQIRHLNEIITVVLFFFIYLSEACRNVMCQREEKKCTVSLAFNLIFFLLPRELLIFCIFYYYYYYRCLVCRFLLDLI